MWQLANRNVNIHVKCEQVVYIRARTRTHNAVVLTSDLVVADHGAGYLLCAAHLAGGEGSFGGEVEAQTIGGHQGPALVCLTQDPPQGEVQDVCGGVVTHDGPTTSLRETVQTEVSEREREAFEG